MSASGIIGILEADYRQLSSDARRSEGFVGLFASTDHPGIKDAAERALLRLRSLGHGPGIREGLAAQCKDLFRPLEMAAATRSPKLVGQALLIAQKLLANGAASPAAAASAADMVAGAAKLQDETVQLRSLQTALTLLQSPAHPRGEAHLGALLGACFGCLGGKGHRGAVTTTALATVRQVLALLLSYRGQGGDVEQVLAKTLADLCAVAAGEQPAWLQTPSLPRAQVLDLLDFVLKTDAEAFRGPGTALGSVAARRLPELLRPQLQDHLTAGVAASSFATSQFPSFRAALECTQTLLLSLGPELGVSGAAPLLETLLAALRPAQPAYQRLAALHAVGRLLADARFVRWLGEAVEVTANARAEQAPGVPALVAASEQVLRDLEVSRGADEHPLLAGVEAALRGKPASTAPDVSSAAAEAQEVALAAVAIESLCGYAAALDLLAKGDDATGPALLSLLRRLAEQAPIDVLLPELLSATQALALACYAAELTDSAEACLTVLGELSLAAERTGPISSVSSSTFAESGATPLTPRNVACARGLMGAVHRLSAWRRCARPGAAAAASPAKDAGGAQPGGATADEVSALATSLAALYASTASMRSEAVLRLLGALQEVSLAEVRAATLAPPAAHDRGALCALGRVTEVLLANTRRLQEFWALFLGHVLEIMASARAPWPRVVAVEALGQVVSGALGRMAVVGGAVGTPRSADAMEAGLEHMLLVALESVFSAEHAPEARHAVLRVLLVVLQRHGERLREGWGAAFRLLAAVPDADDRAATDLGFQAVQLIAGDYAASLGAARLRRCLEVAVAYGAQQDDVNVSLTTISILWNVADLVGRAMPGDATPAATSGAQPDAGLSLTRAEGAEILDIIFLALQNLASDLRPEVRNSGLRTLFGVVMSQWERLERRRREAALWEMLFPLLRHAFQMSVTSSKEEADQALLGKSGGEAVRLVVHHTHNSEAKQWDETVVLALSGTARLLKAHLSEILTLKEGQAESASRWRRWRRWTALLAAHGGDGRVLAAAGWDRLLRAVRVGVEAACNPTCRVPVAVRGELISGALAGVWAAARAGDDAAARAVYAWLARLARHPWSDEDAAPGAAPVVPGLLPPVQKAAMGLLAASPPEPARPALWDAYLDTLVALLSPQQLLQQAVAEAGSAAALPDGAQGPGLALSPTFLHQTLELLVQAFENAPSAAKANAFDPLVEALGSCMALRHGLPEEQLWRVAARAFNVLVPRGLPALLAHGGRGQREDAWANLAAAFEGFLLAGLPEELACSRLLQQLHDLQSAGLEHAQEGASAAETGTEPDRAMSRTSTGVSVLLEAEDSAPLGEAEVDCELEEAVLDTLSDAVLAAAPDMDAEALRRFVAAIDAGVVRPRPAAGPAAPGFSQTCLRKLYVLASRGGPQAGEASGAAPLAAAAAALGALLRRCGPHAARAGRRAGRARGAALRRPRRPAPPGRDAVHARAARHAQRGPGVLEELAASPGGDAWAPLFRPPPRDAAATGRARGQGHLLVVYSSLVHAVVVPEAKTRQALRDVLMLAGRELDMVPPNMASSEQS
ncbi:hypothetical protein QBZ16_002602 [Prototheca wickerhamii]|uniref:Protein MON2 homolog n=1 Tax=Prototheca wickerhamii TaxID=3111 RepID=A0AAD9IMV2_PROWI|nr:hypothetical protein QBZ16_002602 [Prototheca wickerhamii]